MAVRGFYSYRYYFGLRKLFWANGLFAGPAALRTTNYYNTLYNDVNSKANAGFNTTITDYWGLSLSFQLVNPSNGGPGMKVIYG